MARDSCGWWWGGRATVLIFFSQHAPLTVSRMGYYFILHHLVLFLFWTLLAPPTSLHSLPLRGVTIGLGQGRKWELTALKSLETFIGPVYLCVTAQLLNKCLASGQIWLSLRWLGDGLRKEVLLCARRRARGRRYITVRNINIYFSFLSSHALPNTGFSSAEISTWAAQPPPHRHTCWL